MIKSILSVSPTDGLSDMLRALANPDLSGVEVYLKGPFAFKGGWASARKPMTGLGLKIMVLQPRREREIECTSALHRKRVMTQAGPTLDLVRSAASLLTPRGVGCAG